METAETMNIARFRKPDKRTGVIGCYTGRLLFTLVLVCFATVSFADNHRKSERQQSQVRQQQGISAGQAAAIAKKRHGGEVLKVERTGNQYRVKLLLPSGTVKTVNVPAGS
jgi:type VI protein secretion system component VasK